MTRHVVDPAVGYVANWNGKPAVGWIDEYLDPASSRPGGKAQRVQVIHALLAANPKVTPEALHAVRAYLRRVERQPDLLFVRPR